MQPPHISEQMKKQSNILIIVTFFLTVFSIDIFGQKTFAIKNNNEIDSIILKDYKIFSASENVEIDFMGKQIPKSKRFRLTKEQAITADTEFRNQYVNAIKQQYYKQSNDPKLFIDSLEIEKTKIFYNQTIKKFEKNITSDQRKKIKNYDRYFFGYLNEDNERLILMRFDPHKIKYFAVPGAGESLVDVLTIFVFNLNKNILSVAGWADFKE